MPSPKTLSIATWNINSVRLRRGLVEDYLNSHQPDVLCLQETKCPNDAFPSSAFKKLGYEHIAMHGQKGYHGVATLSKYPISESACRDFCKMGDTRHLDTVVDTGSLRVRIHNFYVPAGGDEPDRTINTKFAHKLDFLTEMHEVTSDPLGADGSVLVGDLNIAPLETDVWSHKQLLKVVSHTPVECDALNAVRDSGKWVDLMRSHIPPEEKIFTWWSYRAKDWDVSDRGRRLDHIWGNDAMHARLQDIQVLREARGWERPSDHVPVMARFALG